MIGLSVSFCIKDILSGKVPLEDVDKIIAGTCCYDDYEWSDVLKSYADVYWKEAPDRAMEIFWALKEQGKIDQPRTRYQQPLSLVDGWWVKDETVLPSIPTVV